MKRSLQIILITGILLNSLLFIYLWTGRTFEGVELKGYVWGIANILLPGGLLFYASGLNTKKIPPNIKINRKLITILTCLLFVISLSSAYSINFGLGFDDYFRLLVVESGIILIMVLGLFFGLRKIIGLQKYILLNSKLELTQELKTEVTAKLSSGNTEEAINLLMDFAAENSDEKFKEFLLLKNQLSEAQKTYNGNRITYEELMQIQAKVTSSVTKFFN